MSNYKRIWDYIKLVFFFAAYPLIGLTIHPGYQNLYFWYIYGGFLLIELVILLIIEFYILKLPIKKYGLYYNIRKYFNFLFKISLLVLILFMYNLLMDVILKIEYGEMLSYLSMIYSFFFTILPISFILGTVNENRVIEYEFYELFSNIYNNAGRQKWMKKIENRIKKQLSICNLKLKSNLRYKLNMEVFESNNVEHFLLKSKEWLVGEIEDDEYYRYLIQIVNVDNIQEVNNYWIYRQESFDLIKNTIIVIGAILGLLDKII